MTLYKCGTNLHEDVSGTNVSFSPHAARMLEHVHFTHVWCAVYVDEPSDVLVSKVTKERDLAQDAFGERNLLQCTGDHFDSHGFPGYLVRRGAREGKKFRTYIVKSTSVNTQQTSFICIEQVDPTSIHDLHHRF